MSPATRKLIGSGAILLFLGAYIWAVASLSAWVPPRWWAQFPYYGLSGILWGVPLLPLIRWMNREP